MARSSALKLDTAARGQLYSELSTLLAAGLDLQRALTTMQGNPDVTRAAARMQCLVAGGESLTRAGQRAGVLDGLDLEVVRASEHAGQLATGLKRLAAWHEARAARARLIKTRMVFPAAMFLLAVFIAPLPALFAGSITPLGYLAGIVVLLLQVAAVVWLAWNLPGWLRARQHERSNAFDRARLKLPVLGELHRRREVLHVLDSFELLYSAGVDALQALRLAVTSATNGHVRESFTQSLQELMRGAPLAEALRASGLLSARASQLLGTGDASSRVTEMVRRFCELERVELKSIDEQVAEWLPRLVYALVAGWLASRILGSGPGPAL